MSRYTLPDPLCHHKATVRVSSHVDLQVGYESNDPFASTHCCGRGACQEDAIEWVRASTRRPDVHIVPLRGGGVPGFRRVAGGER